MPSARRRRRRARTPALPISIEWIRLRDQSAGSRPAAYRTAPPSSTNPVITYAFTCLARDWQDIATEDKDAVKRLSGYESFPEWALPLKRKYIEEERASREAAEAAFRVLKDKIDQKKAEVGVDYTINANNWVAHLTVPELARWEAKPQPEKD